MKPDEATLQRGPQAGLEHGARGREPEHATESLGEVEHRDGRSEVRLVHGRLHRDEDGALDHA